MDADTVTGTIRSPVALDWRALERLLGSDELCAQFMLMGEVVLEDGSVLVAYKHRWTRRYLHLGADGTAYRYTGGQSYRRVSPRWLLEEVFVGWEGSDPSSAERQALDLALEACQA